MQKYCIFLILPRKIVQNRLKILHFFRFLDNYLHFGYPTALDFKDFELIVLVVELLVNDRKITFQFEQQSGQRVGIALYFLEFYVAYFENLAEIGGLTSCLQTRRCFGSIWYNCALPRRIRR